jgi:hypothetical protein
MLRHPCSDPRLEVKIGIPENFGSLAYFSHLVIFQPWRDHESTGGEQYQQGFCYRTDGFAEGDLLCYFSTTPGGATFTRAR